MVRDAVGKSCCPELVSGWEWGWLLGPSSSSIFVLCLGWHHCYYRNLAETDNDGLKDSIGADILR